MVFLANIEMPFSETLIINKDVAEHILSHSDYKAAYAERNDMGLSAERLKPVSHF